MAIKQGIIVTEWERRKAMDKEKSNYKTECCANRDLNSVCNNLFCIQQ